MANGHGGLPWASCNFTTSCRENFPVARLASGDAVAIIRELTAQLLSHAGDIDDEGRRLSHPIPHSTSPRTRTGLEVPSDETFRIRHRNRRSAGHLAVGHRLALLQGGLVAPRRSGMVERRFFAASQRAVGRRVSLDAARFSRLEPPDARPATRIAFRRSRRMPKLTSPAAKAKPAEKKSADAKAADKTEKSADDKKPADKSAADKKPAEKKKSASDSTPAYADWLKAANADWNGRNGEVCRVLPFRRKAKRCGQGARRRHQSPDERRFR